MCELYVAAKLPFEIRKIIKIEGVSEQSTEDKIRKKAFHNFYFPSNIITTFKSRESR
jgi:hypothetical protein